jgi:hypothetical protein
MLPPAHAPDLPIGRVSKSLALEGAGGKLASIGKFRLDADSAARASLAPRRAATNDAPGLVTSTASTAPMTESNFIKKLSGIPPWPVRFPQRNERKMLCRNYLAARW